MAAVAAMAVVKHGSLHQAPDMQRAGDWVWPTVGYCGMLLMLISRGLQEGVEDEP
jgi:hypothetical protein